MNDSKAARPAPWWKPWVKPAPILAALTILIGAAYWTSDRFFPASRMYSPQLSAEMVEQVFSDSRVVALYLKNEGNDLAEGVTIVFEVYRPGFTFDEPLHKGHTHILPPTSADIRVEPKRVVVKLDSPLAPKEEKIINIDRLVIGGEVPQMFVATAKASKGHSKVKQDFVDNHEFHSSSVWGPEAPGADYTESERRAVAGR